MDIIDQRTARVTVEPAEGGRRHGSGLVLGDGLVLTALDLVETGWAVEVELAARGGIAARRGTVVGRVERLGVALVSLEEGVPTSSVVRRPWGMLSSARGRVGAALVWWPEGEPEPRAAFGSLADLHEPDELDELQDFVPGHYLAGIGGADLPRLGAVLLAGRSATAGLVVGGSDGEEVVVSVEELHRDGELAWLCRNHEVALPRPVPLRTPPPRLLLPLFVVLVGSAGFLAGLLTSGPLSGAVLWTALFAAVLAAWRLHLWLRWQRHEIRPRGGRRAPLSA